MSLTKQDLKAIKDIVSEESETVAVITNKTFVVMEKRFDVMEKKFKEEHDYNKKQFENIDKRFDSNDSAHRSINARLDLIETDLSNLRNLVHEVKQLRHLFDNVVTKDEIKHIEKRLIRVEKHLKLT